MDEMADSQPSMQEMRARMREVVDDMRRVVSPEPEQPELTTRAPRQTLPLAEPQQRRAS